MNANEALLIKCMRTAAASHRMDGCTRTADLLERGAQKIERLLQRLEDQGRAEVQSSGAP